MSVHHYYHLIFHQIHPNPILHTYNNPQTLRIPTTLRTTSSTTGAKPGWMRMRRRTVAATGREEVELTEENVRKVLDEARVELSQLFDTSVGITGEAELADLDGPFVKIRLRGKFWHKRSTVIARLSNFLKQRIPEVLEVEIEDEKQLDDSPASF